jgi:hypothetical protein
MKDKILSVIKSRRGVSFVELEREIDGFKGNLDYGNVDNNIFYWFGMSNEAADAISSLIREGAIEIKQTQFITYFIDGISFEPPKIAKQIRKYSSPRWIPVVFNAKD